MPNRAHQSGDVHLNRTGLRASLNADANTDTTPVVGELVVPEHGRGRIWKGRPAHPKAGPGRPRQRYLGVDDPAERQRLLQRDWEAANYERRYRAKRERMKDDPLGRAKIAARVALFHAVRAGKIVKPTRCPWCRCDVPERRMYAHQPDPARPLEVSWRCASCCRNGVGVAR